MPTTARIDVSPAVIEWALSRAVDPDEVLARNARVADWQSGQAKPTLRQLERFARATRTPLGYLFLSAPPRIQNPIPDFRTRAGDAQMTPDLVDVIGACQARQEWYATNAGQGILGFVGSVSVGDDPVAVAGAMRSVLGFSVSDRARARTVDDGFRLLRDDAEVSGVMVMVSGVVGNNTRRPLDPNEFRGFALPDPIAPLVFVNGADTRAARSFTLAHELAHIWSGHCGVSDATPRTKVTGEREAWCNSVAAELLVPTDDFRTIVDAQAPFTDQLPSLRLRYKVSTLVILVRARDAGIISAGEFEGLYDQHWAEAVSRDREARNATGGNAIPTMRGRVSPRFLEALTASALEGRTLMRDATHLAGVNSPDTLMKIAGRVGALA